MEARTDEANTIYGCYLRNGKTRVRQTREVVKMTSSGNRAHMQQLRLSVLRVLRLSPNS